MVARIITSFMFISAVAWGQMPPIAGMQAKLKVGDPAPPLSISLWLKGKPVNLAQGKGAKAYVVEFWATWCAPCQFSVLELTDLQAKYGDKNLTVVGITSADLRRGNTLEAIREYVDQWGDRMDYTVAFDRDTTTSDAYLAAANQYGIPTAFVIDREGNIVWIGTPIGPEFREVVAKVIEGSFDPVKHQQIQAKIQAKFNEADRVAARGDMKGALAVIEEIFALDPGNLQAIETVCIVYVQELNDRDGLREWASKYIDKHRSNERAMRRIADQLMNTGVLPDRVPDLAVKAARAAYERGDSRDAETAAIYARALYQVGAIAAAVEIQTKAVAAARGSLAEDFAAVLEFYKACQKVKQNIETS